MVNNKIRAIYILAMALYFVIALAGSKYYSYVEVYSLKFAEKKYIVQTVFAALLIGIAFYIGCAKLWPVAFAVSTRMWVMKILLPLIFIGISYWWNTGIIRFINAPGKELIVKGEIKARYFELSDRRYRTVKIYYVELQDTVTNYLYVFKCGERAHKSIPDSARYVEKKFVIGQLGIIYRKEP